jgi:N-acylneuraminate cytidylyltransferase
MKIAVTPTRGGSKRIPRKNIIKPFCGRLRIAWSIEAALQSGCFDRVIVSTDDDESGARSGRRNGLSCHVHHELRDADDFLNGKFRRI